MHFLRSHVCGELKVAPMRQCLTTWSNFIYRTDVILDLDYFDLQYFLFFICVKIFGDLYVREVRKYLPKFERNLRIMYKLTRFFILFLIRMIK